MSKTNTTNNKENRNMKFKCCLCGNLYIGYGNNPYPLSLNESDKCCNDCNMNLVLPARIIGIKSPCDLINKIREANNG